jgi:hypothetical protein
MKIYPPIPEDVGRNDDDCAGLTWKRGRKMLVMQLSCYGTVNIRVGLRNPAGGSVSMDSFEKAFEWWCSESEELP